MDNPFCYDDSGNRFKIYTMSMPLKWHDDIRREDTSMATMNFQKAGVLLDERVKEYCEENPTADYAEGFNAVLSGDVELKQAYAASPVIRPSVSETPYTKSVAAEVDKRVKRFLRDHNLNSISDYDQGLQAVLDDDPILKEKYNAMGGQVWQS